MKVVPGILLPVVLAASPSLAQITAAPSDAGTIVTPRGQTIDITGGMIGGRNLFHSFQRFGLEANQTANFIANPALQNILGRVVGGDPSVINGRLQVTGGTPNLFLINPAGIVFGPGASLNVPGAFTATTANGIGFGNQWLNAAGANNYAALTGSPGDFAFTAAGAIVNAGNLAVQPGQNLTLLGSTVISTGSLSAPGGQVTIAAIPGEKLVRISQAGSLLSLDLPLETQTRLNKLPYSPVSLPELLTLGNLSGSTGTTIEQGQVKLTDSGLPVQSGDSVAIAIVAHSATILAARNVTLPSSQIHTTADLTVQAGEAVQIQDSANPTAIKAGGSLQMQGRRVELANLNPESRLESGGDLVIRADTIVGDAHYTSGGSLRFEALDGSRGNVVSLHDPVILAIGDVSLGDYTGASLHILAGGSVTLGNVTINALGSAADTINPANATPLNASRALGSLASITRADGTPLYVNVAPTLDSAGNIQRLPQASNQLVIDGSANTTLDVRSGVDWSRLGGLGANTIIGAALPSFSPASRADITIASIQVNRIGAPPAQKPGVVLLTNQFVPNGLAGSIQVGNLRVSDAPTGSLPNLVVIDSRSTIATADLQARHGSVDMQAVGNISAGFINASALDYLGDDSVVLAARSGNIQVATISAGGNGVDVRAGGLVRVTDTRVSIGGDPAPGLILPGTALGDFLISKGYAPNAGQSVPVDFPFDAPDASILSRPTPRSPGALNAPITISYGDGSALIQDLTFPVIRAGDPSAGASVGRIVLRGGGAAFYSVPQFDPVVPGAGPFITSSLTEVAPVPPGTTTLPPALRQNARNFRQGNLPEGVSGTVGILAISSGNDSGFYGSTLSVQFLPPSVAPGTGGAPAATGGGSGTTGGTPGNGGATAGANSIGTSSRTEAAISAVSRPDAQLQQDFNPSARGAICVAATPIAPPNSIAARSSQPNLTHSPCNPSTPDDAQILKLLDDRPSR